MLAGIHPRDILSLTQAGTPYVQPATATIKDRFTPPNSLYCGM
ncbi:hypothetical protein [Enterobacter hormaechei]|nr:hypothetical protein [Enterobacter hormaechei]